MTKRRKGSRSGFDYATYSENRGFHRGAAPTPSLPYYGAYTMTPYYPATATPYHPIYNGYLNSGYGTWYTNAYGAEGFQYMRGYDPSYDAFYTEGPSVDDKWRSTYPYVPTSYLHQNAPDRSNIGTRSRGSRADTSGETETEDEDGREHWGSKWEFIFSCVGLSVGIGNVWRFPYLAYENGGGAFLIPYVILLILVGKPMYFMEVALGQFSQLGPLEVWKNMVPIGRGIGFAMVTISTIVAIYYNVVMGYCLRYLFACFFETLPWTRCDQEWNTDKCYTPDQILEDVDKGQLRPASVEYWENRVLGLDKVDYKEVVINGTTQYFGLYEFGEIGEIKWDLSLCLLLSWIIVFACLAKGIKSSGKVVYFTATFPYVILLILLVRVCLLDGAWDGIKFFFTPNWEELTKIKVWRKAAEQMFFSLSVSWGGLIMFGSYNKFRHRVHYPAFIISSLDFATSIIAGVVVFSVLGELKLKGGYTEWKDFVKGGTGLAFIAYPEAIYHLPLNQLWAVLFFFMLFLLGLDSQFALLETVLTGFYDMFPTTRQHKVVVCLLVSCVCYLLSIPCVSYSGQFIFDLMDTYGGGLGVLWIAIFETIAIMWIYGARRFSSDLKFMLNHNVNYFIIFWIFIPIILVAIFIIACVNWEKPTYEGTIYGVVHYPEWAHYVGWFLTLIVAVQIPVIALIMMCYYGCYKKNFKQVFEPTKKWGPGDKSRTEEWIAYQYNKAARCKQHPYGYDNYAMNYSMPYYNAALNPAGFHM